MRYVWLRIREWILRHELIAWSGRATEAQVTLQDVAFKLGETRAAIKRHVEERDQARREHAAVNAPAPIFCGVNRRTAFELKNHRN